MLFCSPRAREPFCCPLWSRSIRRSPKARGTSLTEPQFDKVALADKDLGRQFAAVFAGHGALYAFDDCRDRTAVILKLLGTVVDVDLGAAAEVFVVGAFISVLKASPSAIQG